MGLVALFDYLVGAAQAEQGAGLLSIVSPGQYRGFKRTLYTELCMQMKYAAYAMLLFVASVISCSVCNECERAVRKNYKNMCIDGIVDYCFIDPDNRNIPTIVMADGSSHAVMAIDMCCFLKHGDSLDKQNGSLAYRVFRNSLDTAFYLGVATI